MFKIQPPFARRNPGAQWRIMLKAPFRLVSSTASKASSPIMATSPSLVIPALFTRIHGVPKSLCTVRTNAIVPWKEATSQE